MRTNLSNSLRRQGLLIGFAATFSMGLLSAADRLDPVTVVTNAAVKGSTNALRFSATNSAPVAAEVPPGPTSLDYSAFRPIADRNIFNAGRSSRSARTGERPKQVQVDTFSVVGTISYAKGEVAFFDGSSASYRKAVKLGESIAGHKVTGITAEEVQLEAGDKKVTLKVGGQMRREDEGPWTMTTAGVSHSVVSDSASSTAGSSDASGSDSGGEVSEVLKRLLQKRAQEEKNENQ